jgi:Zn-dependent protease with chaperone function
LILLAAGKKLSARMDADAYLESFRAEKSVWKRIAELFSSHPHLPKRIAVLRKRAQETT